MIKIYKSQVAVIAEDEKSKPEPVLIITLFISHNSQKLENTVNEYKRLNPKAGTPVSMLLNEQQFSMIFDIMINNNSSSMN